jgi:hypothetical protein
MDKMRYCLFVLMILFLPGIQYAQKIDSMMSIYADNYPQEKLYVQFDKNVYNPGETIWFKAYLFSGTDPSTISKNFYAELSDGNGNLLQRKVAPLFESSAAANFDIPAGIKISHLHFRAYTTWMLNFDTAFVYQKDIPLAIIVPDSAGKNQNQERFFQFFPEGGDPVAGLENTIAFKATDPSGLPVSVKGILKDATGKDILEFESAHDGMGKFLLTPEKDDSLYAVWRDDKGVEHQTNFPRIRSSGVVLRVMNASKKVYFSVARSTDKSDYNRLTIIGHMNQQLVYKAIINLEDNFMSGGSIPVDKLPSGILQLTIFGMNNRPLAERVVFINNHEFGFTPDVAVSVKSLLKKGRNVIDIDIPDTLRSNLSLAITDLAADGKKIFDDNIVSRLLLTGEIKGYVHDPYYYFSNNSDSTLQHLDLVMLTHGWRRFKWDMLAAGRVPVIKYPIENYLAVKAEVLGVDVNRIARDESLYVILKKKDSSVQMLTIPRLSGGKFGVAGLVFYDTARAFYQFSVDRNLSNTAAILFSNGLFGGYKKIKAETLPYRGWTAADSALLQKNRYVMQESERIKPLLEKRVQTLETVTVKGRTKSPAQKLDEEYTSGLFSGGDAYTFDLTNDPVSSAYLDIFNYLTGKVAGLTIVTNASSTSLQWRGSTPSLYLNEMQVDASQLRNTSVSDIAMVKVFRPGSGVGFGGGAGGTIAVYTKKGSENKVDPTIKGLDHSNVLGYSAIREFYAPDYIIRPELMDVEDIRTTLYWKPWILTDKGTQHVTIQFYNNDISRKLRLVLEGFNADGKLTSIEKIIE